MGLGQILDGCLIGQATSDVLPQKPYDFTFLAKIGQIRPTGSHDSQRECRTTRGHVTSPWGEGCWVISSKNSRILILCIYSLYNIYINLIQKYLEYLKLSVEASAPW